MNIYMEDIDKYNGYEIARGFQDVRKGDDSEPIKAFYNAATDELFVPLPIVDSLGPQMNVKLYYHAIPGEEIRKCLAHSR